MTGQTPLPSADVEFGNLEANLRFLDETGLLQTGVRILEIGSGRGTLLHELRARAFDAVGLETNQDRIDEAHARFGELPIHIGAGATLPFPDASFDVVLSFDVFEHIRDSDAHLSEVRRVLAPVGWYLLQTPNKWTNSVFESIRWRSLTRWREDHCALHTYGQLVRRFRRHDFDVEFMDIPVVTDFYREKVRRHLGWPGLVVLAIASPDRWPRRLRTNFYVRAKKNGARARV